MSTATDNFRKIVNEFEALQKKHPSSPVKSSEVQSIMSGQNSVYKKQMQTAVGFAVALREFVKQVVQMLELRAILKNKYLRLISEVLKNPAGIDLSKMKVIHQLQDKLQSQVDEIEQEPAFNPEYVPALERNAMPCQPEMIEKAWERLAKAAEMPGGLRAFHAQSMVDQLQQVGSIEDLHNLAQNDPRAASIVSGENGQAVTELAMKVLRAQAENPNGTATSELAVHVKDFIEHRDTFAHVKGNQHVVEAIEVYTKTSEMDAKQLQASRAQIGLPEPVQQAPEQELQQIGQQQAFKFALMNEIVAFAKVREIASATNNEHAFEAAVLIDRAVIGPEANQQAIDHMVDMRLVPTPGSQAAVDQLEDTVGELSTMTARAKNINNHAQQTLDDAGPQVERVVREIEVTVTVRETVSVESKADSGSAPTSGPSGGGGS